MEAANKGASDEGGVSIGLNITLPMEQELRTRISEQVSLLQVFLRA